MEIFVVATLKKLLVIGCVDVIYAGWVAPHIFRKADRPYIHTLLWVVIGLFVGLGL